MERIEKITKIIPFIISFIIFFIPFLWLKGNNMDLGGDSSRLYFYDPLSYLSSHSLFGISSSGFGVENVSYYGLPFVTLLLIIKSLIGSPTLLINSFHGFMLASSFFSVFTIVKVLGEKNKNIFSTLWSSIISGLLYIFSPTLIDGWDKAIITHNQFFVNPIFFLILLLFFKTQKMKYIYLAVGISFIFSTNFSFPSAPPFFSFFPITIIFMFAYSYLILKKKPAYKKILFGIILMILVHAFHLIPQVFTLLSSTNTVNSVIFSDAGKFDRGLSYFLAIAPSVKLSNNFFLMMQGIKGFDSISVLNIFFPLVIIYGLLKSKDKQIMLIALFFMISLFFASANITKTGFKVYQMLFTLPGFSMFRNFYGQWVTSFTLYFIILFGLSLSHSFSNLNRLKKYSLILIFLIVTIFGASEFIIGNKINKNLWLSKDIPLTLEMDPGYGAILSDIKDLPVNGKVLTLPLTDPGYQMFSGKRGGVYQGPSSISYLTGKKDFAGIQEIQQFGNLFTEAIKNKRVNEIYRILGILNIKYIFFNNDSYIYNNFPSFPYESIKKTFPDNKSYQKLISDLKLKELKKISNQFYIYEIPDKFFTPFIYVPTQITLSNSLIGDSLFYTPFSNKQLNIENHAKYSGLGTEILQLKNTSAISTLRDNYHLHTHDPYLSQSPASLTYRLVLVQESYDLSKHKNNTEDFINFSLLLATKRVNELASYTGYLEVYKKKSNPFFLNNWEDILDNYKDNIQNVISRVDHESKPESWKIKYRIAINEQLEKHKVRVNSTIIAANHSKSEKQYLQKHTENIYSELSRLLNLPTLNPTKIAYELESQAVPTGSYRVYLKGDKSESNMDKITLSLNNTTISSIGTKNEYLDFGVVKNITTSSKFLLTIPSENLVSQNYLTYDGGNNEYDNTASFIFNDKVISTLGGVVYGVRKWKPNTQYSITFEYNTGMDEYTFNLLEKKKEKDNTESVNSYFEKVLKSKGKWEGHQTIITSDINGLKAYIQLTSRNNSSRVGIKIRNLSVNEVFSPNILLVKEKKNITSKSPLINFFKVNPTRYEVSISRATDPFFLVMSDFYNDKWKITKSKDSNKSYEKVDGNISGLIFDILNPTSRDELFAESHIKANDYANTWYIDPRVIGSESFNLTITFKVQRVFYLSLITSIITFVVLLFLLIRSFIKNI